MEKPEICMDGSDYDEDFDDAVSDAQTSSGSTGQCLSPYRYQNVYLLTYTGQV